MISNLVKHSPLSPQHQTFFPLTVSGIIYPMTFGLYGKRSAVLPSLLTIAPLQLASLTTTLFLISSCSHNAFSFALVGENVESPPCTTPPLLHTLLGSTYISSPSCY